MKKTLIITLEYPPQTGGVATYVHSLALALPAESVTVLAPPHRESPAWDAEQSYRVLRKTLLFPRPVWPRWLKMFFAAARLVAQERVERILIHHALPAGYVGLLGRLFWSVPYVVFYHGSDVQVAGAVPWKRRMMHQVARGAEVNVFDSKFLLDKFLLAFPDLSGKTLILPPCPESAFFTPPAEDVVERYRDQYALRGKKVVLAVGRLAEGKGFPHLVRMFPEVLRQAPDAVLVIAGDGPKRNIIAERIVAAGLQNVVRMIGAVPRAELPALYALADVFALLTHSNEGREEGFGLVFLEAAALGVPSVAGACGGVGEAVLHNETGIIVNTYNKTEVVGAIVRLLGDKAEAERLGRRARERVLQDFRWDDRIERLRPWLD